MKLFDATLDLAKIITNVVQSTSTAQGSITTLIDTALPRTPPPDDTYNGGVMWFISGDLAGIFTTISKWEKSTGKFTVPGQGFVTGNNIIYAFTDRTFPLDVLIQSVNAALITIGTETKIYDDASFTVANNTYEYTLPAGVINIKRVATGKDTYTTNYRWREISGKLIFDRIPGGVGDRIRIYYNPIPAMVSQASDTISDYIHPDLLKWTAAVHVLLWRQGSFADQTVAGVERKLAYAQQMAAMMESAHPINVMPRDMRISRWA